MLLALQAACCRDIMVTIKLMRILLAEDERKVASFIARTLRENSYAVDIADTGEKALELGREVNYDAILLDVRLPGHKRNRSLPRIAPARNRISRDDAYRANSRGATCRGAGCRR